MRYILCLLLICTVFLGQIEIVHSGENPLLYSAKNKDEIIKWGRQKYGPVTTENIIANNKEIFILAGDAGFGTSRGVIYCYLYSQERKTWELLLLRFTNTSKITANYDEKTQNIDIISKSGKKLLVVPLDSTDLNYDPQEQ